MKANELMYGNFVMVTRSCQLAFVGTITKHKAGYHLMDKEANMHYDKLYDIEPIEISENFLVLLGFNKWNDDKILYSMNNGDMTIIMAKQDDGTWIFDAFGLNGERSVKFIKYIHELQNKMNDMHVDVKCNIDDAKTVLMAQLLTIRHDRDSAVIEDIMGKQKKETVKIEIKA